MMIMLKTNLALLLTLLQYNVFAIEENYSELNRPQLPEFEAESSPVITPLPQLPPLSTLNPSLSTVAQLYLKRFEFEGHTVFSTQELSEIVKDYQGRLITAEELQDAKNRITLHYIEHNYINSGAIIPDQSVKQGVVVLKIIEGHLTHVAVTGNDSLATDYIKDRLETAETTTLNLTSLQNKLQLLQQNPLIKYIHAELGPGIQLGEGHLAIEVVEETPYQLNFRFNNHRAPSVGAYRGEIDLLHRNVSGLFSQQGLGDSLYLRYGLNQGLKDYTVEYTVPLNRYDTSLSLQVESSDSKVVEMPFNQLDITSEANTYALRIKHPFYRSPNQELDVSFKMEKRTSSTYLLKRPFSFSPGVQDGKSHISVLRFAQDWLDRDRIQVIAARSSFNVGLNLFDATINHDGSPDGYFFTWLGQFQWLKRLEFLDSQLSFRTDLQWARDNLLPLEKFSLGGSSTVRGYRENYLVYDSGLVTSLEWRFPIPIKLPLHSEANLYLAPFIDYGRGWNVNNELVNAKAISSVGIGLIWKVNEGSYAEIYWGKALREKSAEQSDLQDRGIHFEFNLRFPFE